MTKQTPLLSKVTFGALLAYSPRGTTEVSVRSRGVRTNIKSARPQTVAQVIEVLAKTLNSGGLAGFFGEEVALVPAPRSAPLEPGWLWPAENICRAIVEASLAKEMLPCIRRVTKVPKSAFARWGERPTAKTHRDSMEVDQPGLIQPSRITIVDDVVTKGATLLACATIVSHVMPAADVRVFGLIRTRGLTPEIERIVDPCEGEIAWNGSSVSREP